MKGAQGTEHKDHERTTKKSIVRPWWLADATADFTDDARK